MDTQWYHLALHVKKRVVRALQTDVEGEDLCGFKAYDLKVGRPIQGWNANASLHSISRKDDGVPDDVLAVHLSVPTLSQRLRDALEKAGVATRDIQYLPIHVFKSTGEEVEGYAFANVVTRIAALDYDLTDWGGLPPDEDEGIDPLTGKAQVQAIWRAALIGIKLKGHDVVRLVEFFPPVFVSDRFAEVYRKGEFTGATLTPVSVT